MNSSVVDAHRRGMFALDWVLRVYTPTWLQLIPSLVKHAEQLENMPAVTDENAVSFCNPMEAAWKASREARIKAALESFKEAPWNEASLLVMNAATNATYS